MMKLKMKGKTEQQQLISRTNHHEDDYNEDDFFNKSLSIITGKSGISSANNKKNSKMMKMKSSQSNRAWNMGSLMAELPFSPSSIHSPSESPNHPRFSCRPSTVFYSPRNQDLKSSYSFSDLKKQLPNSMNITSSYESSRITEFLGGVQSNGYEPSIDNNDCKFPVSAAVPDKRGIITPKSDEFGEAIPVTDEEGDGHRSHRRLKPYQEFLDEVENQRQTEEVDAMKKATYTHLLRKLTKKEEAIDEWESKRQSKAEVQLDKLERKLEKRRAEAIQKVHKKLAETKLEAQKRKAKARQLALKEMAKHCSQLH